EKQMPRAVTQPFGLRQVFSPRQGEGLSFLPRQLVVRFVHDRAAEVRLLLIEPQPQDARDFLAQLREKHGATEPLSSRGGAAWRDVAGSSPASLSLWQDDITRMTYERLNGVGEWVLRDRPKDHEEGVPLEARTFCSRGPEGCVLGASRQAILRGWKGSTSKKTEDPLILFPVSGEHDAGVVWFRAGKGSGIVARHAKPNEAGTPPVVMAKSLDLVWGGLITDVGCWSHRSARGNEATGLGWLDDRTRLRV